MKYVGGKARLAKRIVTILNDFLTDDTLYIEPFCGGCNVIAHPNLIAKRKWANDANHYVIAMWEELVKGWEPYEVTKEQYKHIRDNKDKYPPYLVGWVGIAGSYRGKWFAGHAERKNPNDKKNAFRETCNAIAKQVPNLKTTTFTSLDYSQLIIPDGSLVYLDPPYINTQIYSAGINYTDFLSWAKHTAKSNTVILSESTSPNIEVEILAHYNSQTVLGSTRNKKTEYLFLVK